MVCNQDQALGKVKLNSAIWHLLDLASHRLVAADTNRGSPPDPGHNNNDEGKRPLRHGHVGVVHVLVDKVQRRANELRDAEAATGC